MKYFVSTAVVMLALYAQAVSAQQQGLLVLTSQQNLTLTEVRSIKPAWSLASSENGTQLVGFANFSAIHESNNENASYQQGIGLGLYQQHTPWLHSQLLVQQHPLAPNQVQSLMEWVVGF
jgi:hypothetical protein